MILRFLASIHPFVTGSHPNPPLGDRRSTDIASRPSKEHSYMVQPSGGAPHLKIKAARLVHAFMHAVLSNIFDNYGRNFTK